jgi:hypothetical protein
MPVCNSPSAPCVALFLSPLPARGLQGDKWETFKCFLDNNMCHPDTKKRYWLTKDGAGGLVYGVKQVCLLLPADPVPSSLLWVVEGGETCPAPAGSESVMDAWLPLARCDQHRSTQHHRLCTHRPRLARAGVHRL